MINYIIIVQSDDVIKGFVFGENLTTEMIGKEQTESVYYENEENYNIFIDTEYVCKYINGEFVVTDIPKSPPE